MVDFGLLGLFWLMLLGKWFFEYIVLLFKGFFCYFVCFVDFFGCVVVVKEMMVEMV